MVIHHFNRIIKNKWVWGVFAVLISAFFAFDFLIADRNGGRGDADSAGEMDGGKVARARFEEVRQDVLAPMHLQYGRNVQLNPARLNEAVWSRLAMLKVAEDLKLTASDDQVRTAIRQQFQDETGAFNKARYLEVCASLGWAPERFEAFIRRELSVMPVQKVAATASWVPPLEISNAVRDMTDKVTVRVASFQQKNADAIKLDDAALKEYYEANTNSLALPELKVIRYVRVPADDAASLAKAEIDEGELQERYDEGKENGRYGTNTFEVVKPQVERELRLEKAVEAASAELYARVAEGGADQLDALARERKQEIKTSRPFPLSPAKMRPDFMVAASSVLPDCKEDKFVEMVGELDPDEPSGHYRVVAGTNAVYVIGLVKERCSGPRVLSFDEIKGNESVRRDALADLKAKEFKKAVDKVREAVKADLAKRADGKIDPKLFGDANVSTSITFVAQTAMRLGTIPDAYSVVPTAVRLAKGELSEFVPTRPGHGLVVYVEDRQPGAVGEAADQARMGLTQRQSALAVQSWRESNMARLGVKPSAWTSMQEMKDEDGGDADDGEGTQD